VIISEKLRLFYLLSALAGLAAPAVAQSNKEHMHHEHVGGHTMHGVAEAHTQLPPLKILLPDDGATVGPQLAVVFQTAADLGKLTVDAPGAGTHLHIDNQDVSVMPTREQLIRLGEDRYLFLFDLPSKPGKSVLRVYWSDAQHETIANTVQQITVTVAPSDGAQ